MSDYDVGFGKPPKKSRWRKGQSGNPGGSSKKKKQHKPVIEALAAQLCATINTTSGGKTKKITCGEALVQTLVHDMLKAPLNGKLAALQVMDRLGVLRTQSWVIQEANYESDVVELSPNEQQLLKILRDDIDADPFQLDWPEPPPNAEGNPGGGDDDGDDAGDPEGDEPEFA